MNLKTLLNNLIYLFYPEVCLLCKRTLVEGEKFLCLHCYHSLPKTNYHQCISNPAEERFKGKIPYKRVSSFLYYSKGGESQKIIAEIKYKANPDFARRMGNLMAKEMLNSSFFEGIDVFLPVPLHRKKLKKRGFNQAEVICRGMTEIYNIPVDTENLFRKIENPTQTKKGAYERWLNTHAIFELKNTEQFKNKHVLVVDDVLTTGSTIEACIHPMLNCEGIKISILTLAIAQ